MRKDRRGHLGASGPNPSIIKASPGLHVMTCYFPFCRSQRHQFCAARELELVLLFLSCLTHPRSTHALLPARFVCPAEVLLDPCRTWCPSSTCQAVCQLKESDVPLPQLVQCSVCMLEFCSACKASWHPNQACQENLPLTSFLPGETR